MPSLDLTTPEDFVNYWFNELRTSLGVFDIQANKVGFLGFIMNILGWTNYDLKNYYDSLFKEAFVATAQDEENLFLHASIYGYLPTFATPATATGNFSIDFRLLPRRASDVTRREIQLGSTDEPIEFEVDGIPFLSDSTYEFVNYTDSETGADVFEAIIRTSDGQIIHVPSSTPEATASFYDVRQYSRTIEETELPRYDRGSFYAELIEVDNFLSSLTVEIWQPGDPIVDDELVYTEFDVEPVKFFVSGTNTTVFLRKISTGIYQLEYGSGTHGLWIPESSSRKTYEDTQGAGGNIPRQTAVALKGNIVIKDYKQSAIGETITSGVPITLAAKSYITANFQYSEGGVDALSSDALRNDIIEYIQTRDNLVSELDYYNIVSKYQSEDVKFLFKKTQVYDNIFYMMKVFRDRFQDVARTTNYTIEELDVDSISPDKPIITSITEVSGSPVGNLDASTTYAYFVQAVNEFFETRWSSQVSLATSASATSPTDIAIELEWEPVIGAQYYKIYGRVEDSQDRYWTVPASQLTFTDLGPDSDDDSEAVFPPAPTVFVSASPGTIGAGTYGYRVGYQDDSGQWFISPETQVTSGVGSIAIEIHWDFMPFAPKYYVWGRTPGNSEQYWVVENPNTLMFLDNLTGSTGVAGSLPIADFRYPDVLFPEFDISNITFVSPFLYRWNDFFGWYDGYLFEPQLFLNFQDIIIRQEPNAFDPPSLYIQITYDEELKKSNIDVKSYQAIGPAIVDGQAVVDDDSSPTVNYPPYVMNDFGSPTIEPTTLVIKFNDETSWTTITFEDPASPDVSPPPGTLTIDDVIEQINDQYGQDVASATDGGYLRLASPSGITPGRVYIADSSTYAFALGLSTDDTDPVSDEDTLNYEFSIFSVGSTDILDTFMYVIDTNTFRYDFQNDFGFIPEDLQLEVKLFTNRNLSPAINQPGLTNTLGWSADSGILEEPGDSVNKTKQAHYSSPAVKQIIDIKDILLLPRYNQHQGGEYILNIPVMELDTYNDDPQFYNQLIQDFMATTQFEENRMITDIVQTRFLNSVILEPPFLQVSTVQKSTILSLYNHMTDVDEIVCEEPLEPEQGDRYLIIDPCGSPIDPFSDKHGQIATWDGVTDTWSYYQSIHNDAVFIVSESDTYRYDNEVSPSVWINDLHVVFPLKMNITLRMNDTYVRDNQVDLVSERRDIIVQVADVLQKKFTGSNITYYNSQIVDLVHSDRIWIDQVVVTVTDSLDQPMNNGIEVNVDQAILEDLLPDKLSIAKYTPAFFYWDVNALEITIIS